jgi:membrane peptidoglycan carboxypeptidase
MQTSLTRRQNRRRNGNGRKGSGGAARRALVAIPLFLFGAMALVAVVGFISAVGVFALYNAGNPEVTRLEEIQPASESIVYDRTGTVELARFGTERRELVTFEQIPAHLLDATTAVEDKTFWTNTGFDPLGIVAAGIDSLQGDSRGASTITQQLVRQRLLDPAVLRDPDRKVERKLREIIQSIKVTQHYQGDEGKRRIITAYLNQNFYGNNSYGVLSAAKSYFGVKDLSELTLAQAAIIAALPQSPSNYDLVRNAEEQDDGTLVVPADSKIVQRRNLVLSLMQDGRTPMSGTRFTTADFEKAKREQVVVRAQTTTKWRAAHFVWAVREELVERVCRPGDRVTPERSDISTCPRIEQGGMKIVTTLDWNLQKNAERWVQASAILPQRRDARAYANSIGVKIAPWMTKIRQNDINNGALIAMDYQTGEIVAYVGSADYYATKSTKKMQAQFDVLSNGFRQPGSAFKPFNYATGINDRTLTAASMFMDVTTDFGGGYTPTNADGLERGPLRVRQALQYSLNIPAIKALAVNREERVFEMAEKFGMQFQDGATPGLSMTLGTLEVLPKDLVQSYATLANGGKKVTQTRILDVVDISAPDDASRKPDLAPLPQPEQVITPQSAYIVTDILQENTDPEKNPIWGVHRITTGKERRPAALKTGTNNDLKDLNAYGFIAPPTREDREQGAYALAVGAWNGNSDATPVGTPQRPVFSNDVTAYVWEGFIEQSSRKWPIRQFRRPDGIVEAEVDAFSGLRPNQFSRRTVTELFVDGTVPTARTSRRRRPRSWKDRRARSRCGRRVAPARRPRAASSTSARSRRTATGGTRRTRTGSSAHAGDRARPAAPRARAPATSTAAATSRTDPRGARRSRRRGRATKRRHQARHRPSRRRRRRPSRRQLRRPSRPRRRRPPSRPTCRRKSRRTSRPSSRPRSRRPSRPKNRRLRPTNRPRSRPRSRRRDRPGHHGRRRHAGSDARTDRGGDRGSSRGVPGALTPAARRPASETATDVVLTERALGRALLARQLLLERSPRSIVECVEQVGGLQTQYAPSGYVGLWTRRAGFQRTDLTAALEDRSLVQATLMRGTIHIVSAREYWRYAMGIRRSMRDWSVRTQGVDPEAIPGSAQRLRDALASGPRTVKELGDLAKGFIGGLAQWVDLVRVPPSGTWERRKADRLALAEEWLGPPDATEDEGLEHLVAAYLRGFGPAPWRDVSAWAGVPVTALRAAGDRISLDQYRDDARRELVDLPDQPLPDPSTVAPVRFLPHWDANLLVHARRTGILPEPYRPRVFSTRNPFSVGTYLVDGRVAGAWSLRDGTRGTRSVRGAPGGGSARGRARAAGARGVPRLKPGQPGVPRASASRAVTA